VTEAEWQASDDPAAMLTFLHHRAPRRKVLHFAAACIERRDTPRTKGRHAALAEAIRGYADGRATFDSLNTARRSFRTRSGAGYQDSPRGYLDWALLFPEMQNDADEVWSRNRESSGFLRCIVGNPFRTVKFDDTWLTANGGAVSRLARAIQEERSFDGLPVLADALEDAGCNSKPLLQHCRGRGPHVPGCWALDLLISRPRPRRSLVETWEHLDRRKWKMPRNREGEPHVPAKRPHPHDTGPSGFVLYKAGLNDYDLSNMTLPRTFFGRSWITRVRFVNTDLSQSWMCWNDFTDCDFSGADLSRCEMRASIFRRCTFNGADLRRADLRRSTFDGCEFTGARMKGAHADAVYGEQDLEYELSPEQIKEMRWSEDTGPEPDGG
jgi:hypothetical protein